jgi:hypothetical protein
LIKVVDRLHNMQTLGAKTVEKQKKTANNTLEKIISCSENCKTCFLQLLKKNILKTPNLHQFTTSFSNLIKVFNP